MKRKAILSSGQVNDREGQETATIYCNPDGSVSVWVVIDSVDYFAFTATQADLARAPENQLSDVLIKSGQAVALYRSTTGELKINSTRNYVFIWNRCPAA